MKIMCLSLSYKKKNMKKFFFLILRVTEERSLIRIWIRTKMPRIPNTAFFC
jgi:hypothetical protein